MLSSEGSIIGHFKQADREMDLKTTKRGQKTSKELFEEFASDATVHGLNKITPRAGSQLIR